MTPRTWAAKKVEKYECGGCHGKVHADAVTDLLVKEHARSVRIVKRMQKGYASKNFNLMHSEKIAVCELILAALQRGRTGRGK